jgi:uncharacterized protein YebE (UPF0316 family)
MTILLLSLLIFALRVIEVGVGTIRIVMLVRERSVLAGVLGFTQSLIFVAAAGIVLNNLDSIPQIVAFAFGFGVGTVLGSVIERQLALGHSILRIVTPTESPAVEGLLREAGYGVTVLNAEGLRGDVRLAWTVVPRKDTRDVLARVHSANADAYVTVQSVSTIDVADRRRRIRS